MSEPDARLASLIGSARDAILVAGPDGRLVLLNLAAEQMFRTAAREALGEPLGRFVPAAGRAGIGIEARGVRADGTEFRLEVVGWQGDVDGQKVSAVVVRDVTDRQLLEAALRGTQRRLQIFMNN